tara:strand:+ start:4828 stop:5220 length:393 start_codon:yes stop_codon:yes gene_type:complete
MNITHQDGKMKITKRQLRKIISEACGLDAAPVEELPEVMPVGPESMVATPEVPVPEDYNAVRDMLEQSPEIVNMAIAHVMDMAGTQCERSTAQGIIDHLQQMVSPDLPAEIDPVDLAPVDLGMIKGPGFM